MALTLEDLAARVEELAREKESTAQHVAALEQEVVTLRAALANRPLAAPDAPPATPQRQLNSAARVQPPSTVRRLRPRPLTRLGLIAAAAAAGASAVIPAPAHAQTLDDPGVSPAPQVGTTAPIISPNGLFALDVTDIGIFLLGPGGRIELTLGEVIIRGAGAAKIQAPLLQLNGGNKPVARVGDTVMVNTSTGPAAGTIQTGAPNVFA